MGYEWPLNFSHFIFDQIYINDKNEKLAHCFSVNQAISSQRSGGPQCGQWKKI